MKFPIHFCSKIISHLMYTGRQLGATGQMELSGKECLVTGGSSGLGLAVSKWLANKGARITLLCRDKEKGEEAKQGLMGGIPGASIDLMYCDLASMRSFQHFIEQFKARHTRLDLLFNNAAVMKRNHMVTEDGFEMMFQVNYLAPFILMNALTGLIQKGHSSLIINNACPSDKLRLNLDDLQFTQHYSMYHSFFLTKLYLLLAGLEYARRHEGDGFDTLMAVPGSFKSGLVREIPLVSWVKNLFSIPVSKAAEDILYVITSDSPTNKNGKVFNKKREVSLSAYWQDIPMRERLWSITEELIHNCQFNQ